MEEIKEREVNVRYERDNSISYAVIDADDDWNGDSDYEVKMLMLNMPEYFLHFTMNEIDGKKCIYYDISSKQQLSKLFEYGKVTMDDVRTLFGNISRMVRVVDEYMLDLDRVILKPQYIYVSLADKKYSFMYSPYTCDEDFYDKMRTLFEYILERFDHSVEKSSLVRFYEIYQKILVRDYNPHNLMEFFDGENEKPCIIDEDSHRNYSDNADYSNIGNGEGYGDCGNNDDYRYYNGNDSWNHASKDNGQYHDDKDGYKDNDDITNYRDYASKTAYKDYDSRYSSIDNQKYNNKTTEKGGIFGRYDEKRNDRNVNNENRNNRSINNENTNNRNVNSGNKNSENISRGNIDRRNRNNENNGNNSYYKDKINRRKDIRDNDGTIIKDIMPEIIENRNEDGNARKNTGIMTIIMKLAGILLVGNALLSLFLRSYALVKLDTTVSVICIAAGAAIFYISGKLSALISELVNENRVTEEELIPYRMRSEDIDNGIKEHKTNQKHRKVSEKYEEKQNDYIRNNDVRCVREDNENSNFNKIREGNGISNFNKVRENNGISNFNKIREDNENSNLNIIRKCNENIEESAYRDIVTAKVMDDDEQQAPKVNHTMLLSDYLKMLKDNKLTLEILKDNRDIPICVKIGEEYASIDENVEPVRYPCTIGSLCGSADIFIDSPVVSKMHACILKDDDKFYIEDMNSTNGIYINDERIAMHSRTRIADGDILRVASYNFKVCIS